MNNLVGLVAALDHCRFYAENMVHIQFGSSLCVVPPEAPYNQPINERRLHSLAESIELAFDNAISRTDLEFPIQGILYRFRSLFGQYVAQYREDLSRGNPYKAKQETLTPAVPERLPGEHEKEFASRFLKYTADQVQAFLTMVCLDQYAREQTDCWLPAPAPAFDQPTNIFNENPIAFTTTHDVLVNHLMEAMLQTHSDTLDIHVSLRDYGLSVIFPLVAECRNVIYAAWPITRESFRQSKFLSRGEHVSFEDLPADDDEETFEEIPPIGPTFENQDNWTAFAKDVAAVNELHVTVQDSDLAFNLDPHLRSKAGEFVYTDTGEPMGVSALDIILTLPEDQLHQDRSEAFSKADVALKHHALDLACVTTTNYVVQGNVTTALLMRICRKVDAPNYPAHVTLTTKI